MRVLASFHDATFGFDRDFVLSLGRTQYLLYHLAGAGLATVMGPLTANRWLMTVYLAGTVLALRSLLAAVRQDERLAVFVVPLLVNVPFITGLLPFVFGIPLLFFALAASIRYFESPSLRAGLLVAASSVALFYAHVIPFGLFVLGFTSLFPWTDRRRWLRMAAPCGPALVLASWWILGTTAGRLTGGALMQAGGAEHPPLLVSAAEMYRWAGDIFIDRTDEHVFLALVGLSITAAAVAAVRGRSGRRPPAAYVLLPLACAISYFALPGSYGYLFFIAERFPILLLITGIPLLALPSGWPGRLITTAAVIIAAWACVNTTRHFVSFNALEVGDFDAALATMAPHRRVCALVYDPWSRIVRNAAFLHFGSYYQIERGGVVMFTYAGFPHWPIAFAPGRTPPGFPARPRWEWTPELVPIEEVYPYYDYVLTRGDGFHPPSGTYHATYRGRDWSVWARD